METAELTFKAIRSVLKTIDITNGIIAKVFGRKQTFLSKLPGASIKASIIQCDEIIAKLSEENLLLYKNLDDSLIFSDNPEIRDFVCNVGGFASTLNQYHLNN